MTLTKTENLTFKMHRKPAVPVVSVADAAKKWEDYRMACIVAGEGGVSHIGNGGTVYEGKKAVAKISYNGRIWEV